MDDDQKQFCPSCKYAIDANTVVCPMCGASLVDAHISRSTTIQLDETEARQLAGEKAIDESLLPERGIAFYTYKDPKILLAVHEGSEFILGRRTGKTGSLSESDLIDLGPFNGFELGTSRRHALIKRKGDAYEITDLESTNGTWLNGERLVPNSPYEVKNGSLLRLGKMMLYIIYRPSAEA